MICLIQLQAAMGFGIFIVMLLVFLFFVLMPIIFTLFLNRIRTKRSVAGKKASILDWAEAALMALIVVVIITVFLLFLIFWAMRDVTFM